MNRNKFDIWFEDNYDYDPEENVKYVQKFDKKYPDNFCVSDLERVWDYKDKEIETLLKIIKELS